MITTSRTNNYNFHIRLCIFCLFSVASLIFAHTHISPETLPKVDKDQNSAVVTDYNYYMILIDSLASGAIADPYSYSEQLVGLEEHLDIELESVMPLGLTPSALILLRPFAAIHHHNILLANTLWTYSSFLIFFLGLMSVHNFFKPTFKPLFFLLLLAPFLLSYNFALNVFIGQTALIATGCLLLLTSHAIRNEVDSVGLVVTTFCMAFLSVKITYLAIGFSVLLIARMFRYAIVSSAVVMTLTTFAALLHGHETVVSWIRQLLIFGSDEIPAHYRLAFNPETYITLTSAFSSHIPADYLNMVSKSVLIIGVPLVIYSAISPRFGPAKHLNDYRLFIFHLSLLFSLFLCFFPYIGGYEDLLIMVPTLFVCMALKPSRKGLSLTLLLLALASLTSNKFFLLDLLPFWSLFFIKSGIFVVLLLLCFRGAFIPSETTSLRESTL